MRFYQRLLPLISFTVLGLFNLPAFAEDLGCRSETVLTIDLRSELGPLRDQDSLGWCYAYGAADQLDHWTLKNQGKAAGISAIALALKYNSAKRRDNLEKWFAIPQDERKNARKQEAPVEARGGSPRRAMLLAIESGYCTESTAPSKDLISSERFQAFLKRHQMRESTTLPELIDLTLSKYLAQTEPDSNLASCPVSEVASLFFPNAPFQDIQAILEQYSSHDLNTEPIDRLLEMNCQSVEWKGRSPKPIQVDEDPESIFSTIDQQLDRGEIAGINYYPDIFHFGADRLTQSIAAAKKTDHSSHYSTLVGKRWNCSTGETDYLLRNSWGENSCNRDLNSYRSVEDDSPELQKILAECDSCDRQCAIAHSEWFRTTTTRDEATLVQQGNRYNECTLTCTQRRNKQLLELNRPSFTCDQGYYVVPASVLKKGIINATLLQ